MTAILAPLLASLLLAQTQPERTNPGEVVDRQGKPVANAEVVLYAPPLRWGKENTAEAHATTDAAGRFQLKIPPLGRTVVNGVNYFAYRPGLAITASAYFARQSRLVLQKPEPRTVKIEGADGMPIAGARVAPRTLFVFGGTLAEIPDALAAPLTVVTGHDGRATIDYLAARDQLVAVRIDADPIGAQDFWLVESPGRSSVEPVITIKLKKTTRLAGQIVDEIGAPVAEQEVEVWSRGRGTSLRPHAVAFREGPLRTTPDGRFQTPENLLVGSTYRIAVKADAKEPIISDWITVGEQPRTLPAMALRSLWIAAGRVADRQGKPIANLEVFQSGDGPEPTATRTDADGRFSLGGFRPGPVFLFARGDGYRFHGQLIRESQRDIRVDLTRSAEPPAREMRMLPEPIPLAESRALAQRLIEPLWKVVVDKGDDRTKSITLQALANADPAGVLDKLESARLNQKLLQYRLQKEVAVALADRDVTEAAAVAESIADPVERLTALFDLVDAIPAAQRQRKLDLLDRAALESRSAPAPDERLRGLGHAAERLYELGEVEKSRTLFAEGVRIANQLPDKTEVRRGLFAAQLALVDAPAALAIAKDFEGVRSQSGVLINLALRLVDQNPAESERLWRKLGGGARGFLETLCWKMATADPMRARRIIESFPFAAQAPEMFVLVALGSKQRDESGARQALDLGLQGLDRLMRERPDRFQFIAGTLLPVVERIDPAFVPEVFWRDVASRPTTGNPRVESAYSPSGLVEHLAWFDRATAAALLEPGLARMEHTEDVELATWGSEFLAWSLVDPRAAVARLEKVSVSSTPGPRANAARIAVATSLGLPYEARWRKTWNHLRVVLAEHPRGF